WAADERGRQVAGDREHAGLEADLTADRVAADRGAKGRSVERELALGGDPGASEGQAGDLPGSWWIVREGDCRQGEGREGRCHHGHEPLSSMHVWRSSSGWSNGGCLTPVACTRFRLDLILGPG